MGNCTSIRYGDMMVCSKCYKHCEVFKSSIGPPKCRHQYCFDCLKSMPIVTPVYDCKCCVDIFQDLRTLYDKLMRYAAAKAVIGAMLDPDVDAFLVEKYDIGIKPLDYVALLTKKRWIKEEVAKYTALELRTTSLCHKLCNTHTSPDLYIDAAKAYVKVSGLNIATIQANLSDRAKKRCASGIDKDAALILKRLQKACEQGSGAWYVQRMRNIADASGIIDKALEYADEWNMIEDDDRMLGMLLS